MLGNTGASSSGHFSAPTTWSSPNNPGASRQEGPRPLTSTIPQSFITQRKQAGAGRFTVNMKKLRGRGEGDGWPRNIECDIQLSNRMSGYKVCPVLGTMHKLKPECHTRVRRFMCLWVHMSIAMYIAYICSYACMCEGRNRKIGL